uniref:Putative secreted protein n=1 Tax=Ixodes ricinus TaxID=34613 RepID=A0A6B0TZJ8_IXORI
MRPRASWPCHPSSSLTLHATLGALVWCRLAGFEQRATNSGGANNARTSSPPRQVGPINYYSRTSEHTQQNRTPAT